MEEFCRNLDESGEICERKTLFRMKKEVDQAGLRTREWSQSRSLGIERLELGGTGKTNVSERHVRWCFNRRRLTTAQTCPNTQ